MSNENIQEIFTDRISDPHDPMRSELDRSELYDLADNIKQNGLINPITVRPLHAADCSMRTLGDRCNRDCLRGDNFQYEVVAGHRRLSACKIAGIIRIKCVVRELTDQKTFEVMAAENLERADVDPVDEAIFITSFMAKTGKSIAEVAASIRRSVAYVENRLAIGEMPDYMQAALKAREIKIGVALALSQIGDEKMRYTWTLMAARDGISVAQAEHWLHGWKMNQLPGGVFDENPPDDFVPGVSAPVLFECAIDGKKYDSRMFRTIMVYEQNLPLFQQVVDAIRNSEGA